MRGASGIGPGESARARAISPIVKFVKTFLKTGPRASCRPSALPNRRPQMSVPAATATVEKSSEAVVDVHSDADELPSANKCCTCDLLFCYVRIRNSSYTMLIPFTLPHSRDAGVLDCRACGKAR